MSLLGSCGSVPGSRNASPAFHLSRSKQQWGGADLSLQNACSHQGAGAHLSLLEQGAPWPTRSRGRPPPPRVTWNVWAEAGKTRSCARSGGLPVTPVCLETERVEGCTQPLPFWGSKEGLQIYPKCIPKSAVGGDRSLGTHPRCCGQIRRVIV